jgi:hypothetical protein
VVNNAKRKLGIPESEWDNEAYDAWARPDATNLSRLVVLGDYDWDDCWNYVALDCTHVHEDRRKASLRSSWHNLAFMDGHASFLQVRNGIDVDANYTVIPFKGLQEDFIECQSGRVPPEE